MPRELGDVLHFFLGDAEGPDPEGAPFRNVAPPRPAALPVIALPLSERDVVRAAFAWNLAVEVARLGASATLVAPDGGDPSPAWPEPGPGPVGADVRRAAAGDLAELYRGAMDVAVSRAADAPEGGLVLVCVPPVWLRRPEGGAALTRWSLLFTSSDGRDLLETYGLAKTLLRLRPDARVGVTVHGARGLADAESAFRRIAEVAGRRLDASLTSYGLLVDDLHVYRAIVARRPVGLAHPQSRAARALRDVARLLLEDAREMARV